MVGERDKKLRDDEERRKMELYLARQDVLWQQNKLNEKDEIILKLKDQIAHQSMSKSSNSTRMMPYYEERNSSEKGEMQCLIDEIQASTNIVDKRFKEISSRLTSLEDHLPKFKETPSKPADLTSNKKLESILLETLSRQEQLNNRIQRLEDFLRQQNSEERITHVVNSSALNSRIEEAFKARSESAEKRLMQSVRATIQKQLGLYNQESLQNQNLTFERIKLIIESLHRDVQNCPSSNTSSIDQPELEHLKSQLQSLTILVSKQHELHSTVKSLSEGFNYLQSSIEADREAQTKSLSKLQNEQSILLNSIQENSHSFPSFTSPQSSQELKTMILEVEQRLLQRIDSRLSAAGASSDDLPLRKIFDEIATIRNISSIQPSHDDSKPDVFLQGNQIVELVNSLNSKVDALAQRPSPNWKKIRKSFIIFLETNPIKCACIFICLVCFFILFFQVLFFKRVNVRTLYM